MRLVPRLSFEPRKFRVRLKILPDRLFVIRQLRRYEWMTLQSVKLPTHELERLLLYIGLVTPTVAEVDKMWAGVASTLAAAIMKVSHLDSQESITRLHKWAENWFESMDSRLELIACMVMNGLSLERMWMMPPEEWAVHVHAGLQASVLLGMGVTEYVDGGLTAFMKVLREQMKAAATSPMAPAVGPVRGPGTMEEYSFQWRKGSEPVIRGGTR